MPATPLVESLTNMHVKVYRLALRLPAASHYNKVSYNLADSSPGCILSLIQSMRLCLVSSWQ